MRRSAEIYQAVPCGYFNFSHFSTLRKDKA